MSNTFSNTANAETIIALIIQCSSTSSVWAQKMFKNVISLNSDWDVTTCNTVSKNPDKFVLFSWFDIRSMYPHG